MVVMASVGLVALLLVVVVLAALREAALADRDEEWRRVRERSRRDPYTAAVLLAFVMSACLAAQADARTLRPRCDGAGAAPELAREHVARDATVCLINRARTRRGLRSLRVDARLSDAARRQAADMVARRYFSHLSPGGSTLADRLARVGYITGRCGWQVGETLAWGTGNARMPSSRVRAWMRSRPHREVLTNPVYRDVGIGVVDGRPDGAPAGSTYAAEFGRRRCA